MRKIFMVISAMLLMSCTLGMKSNSYRIIEYTAYYKQYEMQFISDPPGAKIQWDNNFIGTTPFYYYINGKITSDVYVQAFGMNYDYKYLDYRKPLPRKILFDLNFVRSNPNNIDVHIIPSP